MATKTTTKTAARKPATARKPVKAAAPVKAAPEPKRKETKSAKVETPAKASRPRFGVDSRIKARAQSAAAGARQLTAPQAGAEAGRWKPFR